MNTIDIVLGIILLIAFVMGFKKGLFVTLASLIGLLAGVYGAVYFSDIVAAYLTDWFNWSAQMTNIAAFALTFFIIVFLISLAGKFLTKIADFAFLGIINKLLGGVFNTLKYAFIVSVLFLLVNASEEFTILSEEQREESTLYQPVASLAPLVLPHLLRGIEELEDPEEESPPIDLEESTDE
ncbi:CvpA family protein [Altibacter sp. HG106]|uniref:CvpA family protein n=1 Tax=Altibacter sp. HG106 TaxID=3023937 RepID=UPI002350D5AA|nr:CvpA family protein [Altibacter sp. HG106]MDC7994868.1 CvpA family protein [Altibacter sp. HG106]